ncbi:MAG: hypothetical protein Q4P66_10085 [Actinomycetaceae bacterium]|nr:hypothetical protein [Actinomycetaceae bacterium]
MKTLQIAAWLVTVVTVVVAAIVAVGYFSAPHGNGANIGAGILFMLLPLLLIVTVGLWTAVILRKKKQHTQV